MGGGGGAARWNEGAEPRPRRRRDKTQCCALSVYLQTLLFFAGFLIRFDQIPKYWQWYSYIDVLR